MIGADGGGNDACWGRSCDAGSDTEAAAQGIYGGRGMDFVGESNVWHFSRSPHGGVDKLVWHFSDNGIYSVKSAYKLASSLTLDQTHGIVGQWNRIWKVNAPPKVRHFLWRAVKNNLPTKENLLHRGISVGGECPICNEGYETIWHSFFQCKFAEECWGLSTMGSTITPIIQGSESLQQAIFQIIGLANGDLAANICMVLWQLWKERNAAVWKHVFATPSTALARALSSREEWLAVRAHSSQARTMAAPAEKCVGWHTIAEGAFICSVDAAFFNEQHTMGIGMCIRDHAGNFVVGQSMKILGSFRVEEGELLGIKEALSWLKDLGMLSGFVESDCLRACDIINSGNNNILEMGVIADCCRLQLAELPGFKLRHVKRDRNILAHCLAKAARDMSSNHVWNEPPPSVVGHLHVPCICDQ